MSITEYLYYWPLGDELFISSKKPTMRPTKDHYGRWCKVNFITRDGESIYELDVIYLGVV
jgi:hypothetical protein